LLYIINIWIYNEYLVAKYERNINKDTLLFII